MRWGNVNLGRGWLVAGRHENGLRRDAAATFQEADGIDAVVAHGGEVIAEGGEGGVGEFVGGLFRDAEGCADFGVRFTIAYAFGDEAEARGKLRLWLFPNDGRIPGWRLVRARVWRRPRGCGLSEPRLAWRIPWRVGRECRDGVGDGGLAFRRDRGGRCAWRGRRRLGSLLWLDRKGGRRWPEPLVLLVRFPHGDGRGCCRSPGRSLLRGVVAHSPIHRSLSK